MRLYDAEGDSAEYWSIDSLLDIYEKKGLSNDGSEFYQIDIQDSTGGTKTTDSLSILRIDLWLEPAGELPIE